VARIHTSEWQGDKRAVNWNETAVVQIESLDRSVIWPPSVAIVGRPIYRINVSYSAVHPHTRCSSDGKHLSFKLMTVFPTFIGKNWGKTRLAWGWPVSEMEFEPGTSEVTAGLPPFLRVTPSSLLEVYRRFGGTYSFALKFETVSAFGTFVELAD